MSRIQLLAAALFGALLATGAFAALPARADAPRTAVCAQVFEKGQGANLIERSTASVADWINGQLAAGRTQVVVIPAMPQTGFTGLCAW